MFPQQSLLAVFHGALSAVAHHSGSSILLCAAVLSCSAQELAAAPDNEACSPESPVLFILMPLVPGTTSMSWDWASLNALSMPPMGSSQWGPHGNPMEAAGLSPSVSHQHQAQFTSSSLHQAQQAPPVLTASSNGSTKPAAGPETSPLFLHSQLNQDFYSIVGRNSTLFPFSLALIRLLVYILTVLSDSSL